jgi:soluble lytic murein transglycosylase
MRQALLLSAALSLALASRPDAQQPRAEQSAGTITAALVLAPTAHAPVPRDISAMWFAPQASGTGAPPRGGELMKAVNLAAKGHDANALAILARPALHEGPLAVYADYYAGVSQLRLARYEDARRSFGAVQARKPAGYLAEAAAAGEAEALEGLGDPAAAVAIYDRLTRTVTTAPDDMLMRLGRAAKAAGDAARAQAAFSRVYYDHPLSQHAPIAGSELALTDRPPLAAGSERYKQEFARAERLFSARQYAAAKTAFEALRRVARADDHELSTLRVAESDYYLKRPAATRDALRPYVERATRQAEALFFTAVALRDLGDHSGYLRTVQRIVSDFRDQSWAEDALNNLGTHYILTDDDAGADLIFRELYARFPKGRHADRAAWKIGWRAYREQKYDDTIRYFERAAADFPRSDYRPPWLYWTARAYEALGDPARASERHALVQTDYLNSYYGRLSASVGRGAAGRPPAAAPPNGLAAPAAPPNEPLVRALIAAELYEQADNELRYAQRGGHDSPTVQATRAWLSYQMGQEEAGTRRFALLRGAINTMRRAYPQFMAAGGEDLPREILSVIFPIAYWDLIRKHATARDLDPYLVAALVAQESTFVPDIVSSARAVGLMQLMPPTARQYARRLGLRYSPALLRDPEANIRMGTAYFADKIREFGDVHLALASYNAGERPVRTWLTERPGVPRDEFIDDIPYPDYRRLYGQ